MKDIALMCIVYLVLFYFVYLCTFQHTFRASSADAIKVVKYDFWFKGMANYIQIW